MTLSFQTRVGPVARTVASLGTTAPGARPPTTAQTLAALLDFQGSIQLAHCLRSGRARAGSAPPAGGNEHAPLLLGDYVRRRVEAFERSASERSGLRLPTSAELHAQIEASGESAFEPAMARGIALAVARAWRDQLIATLAGGRTETAALREEIVDDLRRQGGDCARLQALDEALHRATLDGIIRLHERLATALEGALQEALARSIAGLTPAFTLPDIEPWFLPDGAIGRLRRRAAEALRSLVRNDGAVLIALADAVCAGGQA